MSKLEDNCKNCGHPHNDNFDYCRHPLDDFEMARFEEGNSYLQCGCSRYERKE